MGIELIIGAIALAITIGSTVYMAVAMPKSKNKNKQSIDSFQVTRAEEGQCIPIVYGSVRVPGSIIWYGNVRYKNIKPSGGKGGGGGGGSAGFKTYVDAHIVLCEGKIELVEIYKDEEVYNIDGSAVFNDGTTSTHVVYEEYATKLPGVAHIHFSSWFLGNNVNTIPSLSFEVKRILTTPLLSLCVTGENPAVVVYDLISKAGGTCDLVSFQLAADYFNSWGVNLVFDAQDDLARMIEKVQQHVDFVLYQKEGIYYINQTHMPGIAEVIDGEDIKDFSFTRVAYNQIFNDFSASYRDVNYTERTARLVNEASYALTGERKTHSFDLKGFRTLDVMKSRFSELFDRESYPFSEIKFKTSLKYYDLMPGDTINLDYSRIQTSPAFSKLYIIEKMIKDPFAGQIEITARETPNGRTFGSYEIGTPTWTDIDMTPEDLDNVAVVPFRYGEYRQFNGKLPVLILPERKKGCEMNYDLYFSRDSVNYEFLGTFYTFASSGELKENYTNDTFDIDDYIGIRVAYTQQAFGLALDALTRPELFTTKRVLVVNTEIMKFQTAETIGGSTDLRLMGVLRDSNNKQSHSNLDKFYVTEVIDNVFDVPLLASCYFKVCPRTPRGVLDIGDATAIEVIPDFRLSRPAMLKAERSGEDIFLEIFPNSQSNYGAGYGDADLVNDSTHPLTYQGTLLISLSGGGAYSQTATTFEHQTLDAITFTVAQNAYGFTSNDISVLVDTADGEYYS
jgi:hypothetical protein